MRQTAFWSGYGRGACGMLAAACVGLAVAGCSSTSRFDFPAFNLTSSDNGNADLAATAALPVPEESVYSSGSASDGQLARTSLPPPSYTPRPSAAAYSPQPNGRVGAEQANYPAQAAPRAEPAHRGPGPVEARGSDTAAQELPRGVPGGLAAVPRRRPNRPVPGGHLPASRPARRRLRAPVAGNAADTSVSPTSPAASAPGRIPPPSVPNSVDARAC